MKVLVATGKPFTPSVVQGITIELKNVEHEVILPEKYTEKAKLLETVKDADVMIVRSDKVTPEVLDTAKRLKIVVRAGTGYDSVDTTYAKEKSAVVEDAPGQSSNAVAELVFDLLVYTVRNFYNGKAGTELVGKKIGTLAFGNVGRNAAHIAKGFGMEVYAYGAFCPAKAIKAAGVRACKTQDELFQTCDALSLHILATPQTVKNIDYRLVNLLPKKDILINIARKEVINKEELLESTAERKDLKSMTDIMPDADTGFKKFEGRYLSAPKKMGAQTAEANNNTSIAVVKQISAFFATGDTKFQVNK